MKTASFVAVGMAVLTSLACGGKTSNDNPAGCGINFIPGYQATNDAGENVVEISDAGVVEFAASELGAAVRLAIPVKNSFDVNETILGASFSGPQAGAFQVTSAFPLPVPAGTEVNLQLVFTPTVVGVNSAKLALQTEDMGISPIDVEGTGVADAG